MAQKRVSFQVWRNPLPPLCGLDFFRGKLNEAFPRWMLGGVCGVFSIFVERWLRVPTINHIITNIITTNQAPLAGLTIY